MHFVPLSYEDADEFRGARWNDGGEGLTALDQLHELEVGDDVIVGVAVRRAGERAVMRGSVIWKRTQDDARHGLRAGAGVRIHRRDLHRLAALESRVAAGG